MSLSNDVCINKNANVELRRRLVDFERCRFASVIGEQVDELDVSLLACPTMTIQSHGIVADNLTCRLFVAYTEI